MGKDGRRRVEDGLLDAQIECTENFSGAVLKDFAPKVKLKAFSANAKICGRALFQECLSGIYPASNAGLMQQIRQWEALYRSGSQFSGISGIVTFSTKTDLSE